MRILAIETTKPTISVRISRLEIGIIWYSKELSKVSIHGTITGLHEKGDGLRFYIEGKAERLSDRFNQIDVKYLESTDRSTEYGYSIIEIPLKTNENVSNPIHFEFTFSLQTVGNNVPSVYVSNALSYSLEGSGRPKADSIPIDVLDVYCFYPKTLKNATFYPQQRLIPSALEDSIRNLFREKLGLTDQSVFAWNDRGVTNINPFEVTLIPKKPLKKTTEKLIPSSRTPSRDRKKNENRSKRILWVLIVIFALISICIFFLTLLLIGKGL